MANLEDFERLGVFYLGREYDLAEAKPGGPKSGGAKSAGASSARAESARRLLLYDSKDLLTHAVCVGMTGSGKTGLCVALLEEAAIDGVPCLVIDPKGDLSNLLLTFPALSGEEFLPWVDPDEARKKGLSPEAYAAEQAELWRRGLADWGQDGERIRRLREAAEFAVYTPGSSAGLPVSILRSFAAPPREILNDDELLHERIATTVSGLLGLLGVAADPLQSREHILLSSILNLTWRQGLDLDLAGLIEAVQAPGMQRIGVLDIEAFYPAKDRFELAMKLNNLLAAPAMQAWLEGPPLDIGRLLYTPQGRARVSIFSLAHLDDTRRMFFVSLLLLEVLGWVRSQPGTTSLRAVLYMDEIFGYLPPVANPPSKAPLLTLLKQARAFGLGVVLATQNPVDLDYKGLSNTGTWFIGRLQTERDKERVLDGLEGAGASAGGRFDRRGMSQILAGLGKRVFLMNNVHEDQPVIFESRWALSYLRGPLTREQIKTLMAPARPAASGAAAAVQRAATGGPATAHAAAAGESPPAGPSPMMRPHATVSSRGDRPPALPPGIPQFFLRPRSGSSEAAGPLYEPFCLALGKLYYLSAAAGLSAERPVAFLAEVSEPLARPDWDGARPVELAAADLETRPEPEALFGDLPPAMADPKSYPPWSREFRDWLYRTQVLGLLRSPSTGVLSAPGESERDFRLRLQQDARERRDQLVERIRQKYASRLASLEERVRKAAQSVDREKEQAKQQKIQTAISVGVTVLDAFMGRKTFGRSTIGRATTAARGVGRVGKQGQDVAMAKENLEALQARLAELQGQLEEETQAVLGAADPLSEILETIELRPKKTDIAVTVLALGWVPYRRDTLGGLTAAL